MNVDRVEVVTKDARGSASPENIFDYVYNTMIDLLDLFGVHKMLAAMNVLDGDEADKGFVGVVILEGLFDQISQRFLRLSAFSAKRASIALTEEYAFYRTAVNTPSLSPK